LYFSFNQAGGAIYASRGETVVNDCVFLDNVAETTAAGSSAVGGAIYSVLGKVTVVDSIFKKNKAIATASGSGGGGVISALFTDVLVLSSVFELNEVSSEGGAALFGFSTSVAWYNNKELLSGNDAGIDCDGANVVGERCFSVEENFSL